ncbi:MAG TPA: flagellin [Noviherbaspirillum sp.]
MPHVIGTNLSSLSVQRALSTSANQMSTAMERLSSGLRINSARDDAAGLSISARLTAQIRGRNQAVRNVNDGISLVQTAEGALGELTDNLQRIRELAVQSANATSSASDRASLDQEVQQRLAEVQRIAAHTSFNGLKLLDGSLGTNAFQVGANPDETIRVDLGPSMQISNIGAVATGTGTALVNTVLTPTGAGSGAVTNSALWFGVEFYNGVASTPIDTGANVVTINGGNVGKSADYAVAGNAGARGADSAYAKAAAINASGLGDVTATASTTWSVNPLGGGRLVDIYGLGPGDTMGYSLTLNGVNVIAPGAQGLLTSTNTRITIDQAIEYINARKAETGVDATKAGNGNLVLTALDGRNITVQEAWTFTDGAAASDSSSAAYMSAFGSVTITDDATDSGDSGSVTQAAITHRGQIALTSSSGITINAGGANIGFGNGSIQTSGSLTGQNVLTVNAAKAMIASVDSALRAVSQQRSTLGATQNRLAAAIDSITASSENLAATRSRIQDTDFAMEVTILTRAQILQKAGAAVMAQANAVPQAALLLLR